MSTIPLQPVILCCTVAMYTIAMVTTLITETMDDGGLKGYELLNVLVSTTCASGEGALGAMLPIWAMIPISGASAALESYAIDSITNALGLSNEQVSDAEMISNAVSSCVVSSVTAGVGGCEITDGGKALIKVCDLVGNPIVAKTTNPAAKKAAKIATKKAINELVYEMKTNFVNGTVRGQSLSLIGAAIKNVVSVWGDTYWY